MPATPLQRDAVAAAIARAAGGGGPLVDDERAGRRILPRPHTGPEIGDALRGHFAGEVTTQTYEIADQETIDTLLVPSNQEEYLPEIEDPRAARGHRRGAHAHRRAARDARRARPAPRWATTSTGPSATSARWSG